MRIENIPFFISGFNYSTEFAWTRDRPKNGKPTEMTHRFLTYAMTVICFFLSIQEKSSFRTCG